MIMMLLAKRAISSPKSELFHFLLKQSQCQAFSSISCNVIPNRSNAELLPKKGFQEQLRRPFHVTVVNKDIEAGLRALGAGVATTAIIGPGIGMGIIFGNFLSSIARNPSLANKLVGNVMMGAAFCESLGLFGLTIAFMVMS